MFILIRENGLKERTFSWNKKYFLGKKSFLNIKKISLVLKYVLNSSQIFLKRGQENFSQWVYFSCFKKNILIFSWFENVFLKWRKYFSISVEAFAACCAIAITIWRPGLNLKCISFYILRRNFVWGVFNSVETELLFRFLYHAEDNEG